MANKITVNETQNTVTVNETTNTVTVTEGGTTIVRVKTEGPQGPPGSDFTLSDDNKVDKSIIYYDSTAGVYKANSTWTTNTLTDGGNF
tara:strand:- start:3794 stop:4057 length:264 start_codon:yes stop_codon:yes gene_type:complete